MKRTFNGLMAGLTGTIVLTVLLLVKSASGLLPELDVIAMLAAAASEHAGLPARAATGWALHLVLGTVVWGLAFAWLWRLLPGPTATAKGMVLGVAAWLVMALVVMPLAGAGLLGLALGVAAPLVTLALHLVFGAVLGSTYHTLATVPQVRTSVHLP